jgi:hypothetical protein
VRVLVYMFGEETAEEGEGEVGQRYREQHAACPTVKGDDRLFVAVSGRLAGHTISGPVTTGVFHVFNCDKKKTCSGLRVLSCKIK